MAACVDESGFNQGKEHGLMILRLLNEYMKENERKWTLILKKVNSVVTVLK